MLRRGRSLIGHYMSPKLVRHRNIDGCHVRRFLQHHGRSQHYRGTNTKLPSCSTKRRRSTTGYAFTYAGGAIVYRSKAQSITAQSSTEAEFIAAVTAAKTAKYLRSVLIELGFPQNEPTPIYEDNASAIEIINAQKPTERSRHIEIRFFAIQDWKMKGEIKMLHIPGVINPADDLTKPLGWILHARHARYIMGHYSG